MARRKKEADDEVEKLELEVRKLKSENRHLHKQLKKSNKKYKPSKFKKLGHPSFKAKKECPLLPVPSSF